jgi:hypothetical protein
VLGGQKIVTASHLKATIAELKREDKPSRNG